MTLSSAYRYPQTDKPCARQRIHKALSKPGTVVSMPALSMWGNLSSAATAVMMTLSDRELTLWVDSPCAEGDLAQPLPSHAVLRRIEGPLAQSGPEKNNLDGERPGQTIVIDVARLSGGLRLRLRGAGMIEPRAIAPQLPAEVLGALRQLQTHGRSLSHDVILTSGEFIMALPASVSVELD